MSGHRRVVGPPLTHVLEEELGEEMILFDSARRHFVSLNESAADIWRLSTGEFTVAEIVDKLAAFYGTEPVTVREAVETAVGEFVVAKLIPPVDG